MQATFDKNRADGLKEFWYQWEYKLILTKGVSKIYCDNRETLLAFIESANKRNPNCIYTEGERPDDLEFE